MYITKQINWLKEYFDLIKNTYPEIKKIVRIKKINFSYLGRDRASAQLYEIISGREKGKFELNLRVEYQWIEFYPLAVQPKPYSKVDILRMFAHELAHCYGADHTPNHGLMENNICNIFYHHLKSTGYISEEDELGGVQ